MILSVLAVSLALSTLPPRPAEAGDSRIIEMAQARDIEIVLDEFGRRYIVDRWSGEVITVLPARRGQRGDSGRGMEPPRLLREREKAFGYYDDEEPPADILIPRTPKTATKKPVQTKTVKRVDRETITGTAPKPPKTTAPATTPFPSGASEAVAKAQILLDRAGISPGAIDGRAGTNFALALDAYERKTGNRVDVSNNAAVERLLASTGGAAFTGYAITATDVAGPYVASIPSDYGQKATLDRLSFTSTVEMLAERFHMSQAYLRELNPGVSFTRPGVRITVAAVGTRVSAAVSRIVADKGRKQVRAYDSSGRLVVAYPATIGSADTPSPSGTVAVDRIAFDPEYTYNPKLNFKQGSNDRILTIPPGPNGPVGTIWIALSKPTYGIHGTPEPEKIGKTESHGCVRLTNWDADELARMVKPGTVVEFAD